jgi:hypothetical protein
MELSAGLRPNAPGLSMLYGRIRTQHQSCARVHFACVFKAASRSWACDCNTLATYFSLDPKAVLRTFLSLETQDLLMRGSFERAITSDDLDTDWCERRIQQRMHKLTIGTRRQQIEPVSPSPLCNGCLDGSAPQTQVSGEDGLLEAISKLEGFELRVRAQID